MAFTPEYISVINPTDGGQGSLDPGQVDLYVKPKVDEMLLEKMDIVQGSVAGNVPKFYGWNPGDPPPNGMIMDSGYPIPPHGFMSLEPSAQTGFLAEFDSTGQVVQSTIQDTDVEQAKQDIITIQNELVTINNAITDLTQPGGIIEIIQQNVTNNTADIQQLQQNKMDKVPTAVAGNLAVFDGAGQVLDFGSPPITQVHLAAYLPLAGGTMTGPLKIDSTYIEAANNPHNQIILHDNYARWRCGTDVGGEMELGTSTTITPTIDAHINIKTSRNTGPLGGDASIVIETQNDNVPGPWRQTLQGVAIYNLNDPVEQFDAVNKKYVDDVIQGIVLGTGPMGIGNKADKVGAGHAQEVAFYDSIGNLAVNNMTLADLLTMQTEITNIQGQIAGISGLGHFIGSVQTDADIPAYVPPVGATLNDYIMIEADSTQGGVSTYYVLTSLGPPVVFTYGGKYSTSLSGAMLLQPGAGAYHFGWFDGTGQIVDSGKIADDFVNAVPSAPNNDISLWDGLGQQKASGMFLTDLATVTALAAEEAARVNATIINAQAIAQETADRQTAITAVHTDLAAEATARAAADTTLTTGLNTEISNRQTAVSAVQSDLNLHKQDSVIHVTQANKDNWNAKQDAITAGTANMIIISNGTTLANSGVSIDTVVLSTAPTVVNKVAYYSTKAQAQTASTANPTWICFFPDA